MTELIKHKYGNFNMEQVEVYKTHMQKKIFWLILYTDKETSWEYPDVDVIRYHKNIMIQLSGLNSLLFYPPELVAILSELEAAFILLNKDTFDFKKYRKLILDAGAQIKRLKVGD